MTWKGKEGETGRGPLSGQSEGHAAKETQEGCKLKRKFFKEWAKKKKGRKKYAMIPFM